MNDTDSYNTFYHEKSASVKVEIEEKLGFKPQKTVVYNQLLPYADQLLTEAGETLAEIKANLGCAILRKELRPGVSHWMGRLDKYVRLYGHMFSKADHVLFVKTIFDLMVTSHLEFTLLAKTANLLVLLLKKRHLLSPSDLELPWKPLHDLVEVCLYNKYESHGLILIPKNLENILKNAVRTCRPYFPVSSTREMLDEFRPLLCPFDVSITKGLFYLELFLPTLIPPEHHDIGFKLWLDEFFTLWDSVTNSPPFENALVWLFARLAFDNVGVVNWSPWIPKIFTRIMRSFNLPTAGHLNLTGQKSRENYEMTPVVAWIVAMLGGDHEAQTYLEHMLKAMESFYHPSNYGKWSSGLLKFMNKLSTQFVKRLHRERYQEPNWEPPIPKAKRLTEENITRFVQSLIPVVHLSIFSKLGSSDSASTLHHLSSLRPEIVIPPLLDKLYAALETLTEPHRLTATLNCMVGVSRAMLSGCQHYPEGRIHALPILQMSLPGLDPNDLKKCMVTFQFLSTMFTLIPFVDCSPALGRKDLTEVERQVCEQTAHFEDFVMLFLDKVLILIENCNGAEATRADAATWGNSAANQKLTNDETMMQIGMTSTVAAILQQSSPQIYKLALDRIFRFATTSVLEPKLAGRYTGDLVRSAVKVDPPQALKLFLPFIHKKLMSLITDSTMEEESLDKEVMWNLQMMSEIVRSNGQELIKYKRLLVDVLKKSLRMTCKQGYEFGASILRNLFKALTLTYCLNYTSVTDSLDSNPADHLYVRDWAKPGDVFGLGLEWHCPNEDENQFAQELFDLFVVPELEELNAFSEEKLSLKREQLQRSLNLILQTMQGLACALPQWQGATIHPLPSKVSMENSPRVTYVRKCVVIFRSEEIEGSETDNVRAGIAFVMRKLKDAILKLVPDDTKSLYFLIAILHAVLLFHGASRDDFDARWKSFHVVKRAMENQLVRKKRHMRALLIDRTVLQHERRLLNRSYQPYNGLHLDLLQDLFQLSTSHYSEVRIRAQNILSQGVHVFTYSYMHLIDNIVELLKESSHVSHDQFKGALYVLIGPKHRCLAVKPHWSVISSLWPAIVQAQHSEKPSIQLLMDTLVEKITKNMDTISIDFTIRGSTVALASQFWSSQEVLPRPSLLHPSPEEIQSCIETERESVLARGRAYEALVLKLVDLVSSGNLRWKFAQVALSLAGLLFRYDRVLPTPAVRVIVDLLVHDTVVVRKMAITGVSAVLKQTKRAHPKVEKDVSTIQGVNGVSNGFFRPGSRDDNRWLDYDLASVPKSAEEWERTTFVDKTHWGFYCWPKNLQVYASSGDQPSLSRTREEMTEVEGILFDFFNSESNVDKLIQFLSLEEKKGKDKFNAIRFTLFKGLFRNYGDSFLRLIRPHLERLSTDANESLQRCAAEIISGLIRGSKHWPYESVRSMWEWLIPLLKTALSNITTETVVDWGTCIATSSESRDPRRIHWLLEAVMESPIYGQIDSSFRDTNHLYALQGALSQQEWRVPELLYRHLDQVLPHIHHPYKNMRDRIGSVLTSIYMYDWTFPGGNKCRSPMKESFIHKMLPSLEVLKQSAHQAEKKTDDTNGEVGIKETDDYKKAVQVCETLISWYKASATRTLDGFSQEMFDAIPYFCALEGDATDEALKKDCFTVLYVLASAQQKESTLDHLIDILVDIKTTGSWHARMFLLRFLQIMVFTNLPLLKMSSSHTSTLTSIVTELLVDEQLEVREAAGNTLGGFFHCRFAPISEELVKSFRKLARTRIKPAKTPRASSAADSPTETIAPEAVYRRHGGVLGLCAIIQAFPYDVPEVVPPVLMGVCEHIHDPMPISGSVKRALSSFKRTHHDNWQDHKLKFNEDQLVTLTDVLVSPNYYA